jgi:uncharacterized protein YkwD
MRIAIIIYLTVSFLIPQAGLAFGNDDEGNLKLRDFKKYMLDEVNFVRTKPAEYAEIRLLENKKISTDNGAYDYLKKIKPVKTLVLNEILNSTALEYAKFMAGKGVFSHNANGTPFERVKKAGYRYSAMAENIACGSEYHYNAMTNPESSAIEFVKMLIIDKGIKDLGHRKTMMNPVYRSVGFGFAHNQSSYCINYVVQDFGNP